jgi:hypothetical protein
MKVRLDNEKVAELMFFGMPMTPLIITFGIAAQVAIY